MHLCLYVFFIFQSVSSFGAVNSHGGTGRLKSNLLTKIEELKGIGAKFAVDGRDRKVEESISRLCAGLEANIDADSLAFPSLSGKVEGCWRLLYSNNSPGTRTGESTNGLLRVSAVYQIISFGGLGGSVASGTDSADTNMNTGNSVANVLRVEGPWPLVPRDGLRISLMHSCAVQSQKVPALLAIDLESVEVNSPGTELPSGTIPWSKIVRPFILRRGYFETSYVDDDLRLSRGPLGEIRVFRREEEEEQLAS